MKINIQIYSPFDGKVCIYLVATNNLYLIVVKKMVGSRLMKQQYTHVTLI